jgi:large subunit ribosomal protein L19
LYNHQVINKYFAMNTKLLAQVEESGLKKEVPAFRVGDTLRLGIKVKDTKEGERIQYFEGILIRETGSGLRKNITVRKIGANGIGVERIIPINAPVLDSIEIKKKGKVRRAKLYYLRDRIGKAAMAIKERTK